MVRSCVYTYEQITGGNTTVMWAIEMMVIHKLTTRCIHDSSCIYAHSGMQCASEVLACMRESISGTEQGHCLRVLEGYGLRLLER